MSSSKYRRHDSQFSRIDDPTRTGAAPSETSKRDLEAWTPTNNGKDKVYYQYALGAHLVRVECDLSPGFKLDDQYRLVSGHVRGRCPMPDCEGWWHIPHDKKTVYCWPMGHENSIFMDLASAGGWYLSSLSVVQPVHCPYNFRTKGVDGREPCSWRATIQNGIARDYIGHDYQKSDGGVFVRG